MRRGVINQDASLIVQRSGARRYELHLSKRGLLDLRAALKVAEKYGQTSGSCLTDAQNSRIADLLAEVEEYLSEVTSDTEAEHA